MWLLPTTRNLSLSVGDKRIKPCQMVHKSREPESQIFDMKQRGGNYCGNCHISLTFLVIIFSTLRQTTQRGRLSSLSVVSVWASSLPFWRWWSRSPVAPTASRPAGKPPPPPRNERAPPPTRRRTPATPTRIGTPTRTCRRDGTGASSARST